VGTGIKNDIVPELMELFFSSNVLNVFTLFPFTLLLLILQNWCASFPAGQTTGRSLGDDIIMLFSLFTTIDLFLFSSRRLSA
jgi:hypothetical protein